MISYFPSFEKSLPCSWPRSDAFGMARAMADTFRESCSRGIGLAEFLPFQYLEIVSVARDNHCVSSRNLANVADEKYFTALGVGCPSGFRNPARTRIGMSCALKPRNHAVSCELSRAGIKLAMPRKSFLCGFKSFPPGYTKWSKSRTKRWIPGSLKFFVKVSAFVESRFSRSVRQTPNFEIYFLDSILLT